MDSSENALLQKAFAESQAGNFAEAEKICLSVVAKSPFNAVAWSALGAIALRAGQVQIAIQRLQKSIECAPRDWATLILMVQALWTAGATQQAADFANRALKLRPSDPEILLWTAICSIEVGAFLDADKCLTILRQQYPEQIAYTYLHAQAVSGLGRDLVALRLAERCVAQQPTEEHLGLLLKIQVQLYRFEDAVGTCLTLLAINSESPIGRVGLASALTNLGKTEEAEAEWQKALNSTTTPIGIHIQTGYAYQQLGQFAEAENEFKKALHLHENDGESLYAIFSQRRVTRDDIDLIDRAQAALRSAIRPSNHDRKYLNFALGKAFNDLGNYALAMACYDEANSALRVSAFGGKPFDPSKLGQRIQTTEKLFTSKFIGDHQVNGSSSNLPIFVVGMIRSGTTLVHQVLSSHAEIGGADELAFWATLSNCIVDYDLNTIDTSKLHDAATEYEELLRFISPGSKRVVDKNPANFINLGLLNVAFPNAKIIYVRRNNIDVAMSLWTTPVESNAPFLGDRDAIVYALEQTEQMVQYWQKTLPPDSILEIRYEDLVSELETTARKMIAFCGLDWDDACLHPETNQHLARTPSFWQVRQKISTSCIDRYRAYGPWLGSFTRLNSST
jgi:tetratricopeptide (TPR) repeat protein